MRADDLRVVGRKHAVCHDRTSGESVKREAALEVGEVKHQTLEERLHRDKGQKQTARTGIDLGDGALAEIDCVSTRKRIELGRPGNTVEFEVSFGRAGRVFDHAGVSKIRERLSEIFR